MKDDRGQHDLTKIIDDYGNLVDELRTKLKLKCNQVLDCLLYTSPSPRD